jgi:hypothetical protein
LNQGMLVYPLWGVDFEVPEDMFFHSGFGSEWLAAVVVPMHQDLYSHSWVMWILSTHLHSTVLVAMLESLYYQMCVSMRWTGLLMNKLIQDGIPEIVDLCVIRIHVLVTRINSPVPARRALVHI